MSSVFCYISPENRYDFSRLKALVPRVEVISLTNIYTMSYRRLGRRRVERKNVGNRKHFPKHAAPPSQTRSPSSNICLKDGKAGKRKRKSSGTTLSPSRHTGGRVFRAGGGVVVVEGG